MTIARILMLLAILMIQATAWAWEDCDKSPLEKWGQKYSYCRIANALELIAEKMK